MKTKQNMAALQYGNSVRVLMADEKRRIKRAGIQGGIDRVIDMLRGNKTPHHVERMRVGDLLRALDRMGPSRAARILAIAGVQGRRYDARVEDLTERERAAVASAIEMSFRSKGRR